MAGRSSNAVTKFEVDINLQSRIEAIAARLFITHGYNGVSYLDIARELGISHSNIHYYFRTKPMLASAVLSSVASETVAAMEGVWAGREEGLFDKFVAMRGWAHEQYLQFNPGGKGGRLWGLLARFSMDADSLNDEMRRLIRATLRKIEEHIAAGIQATVDNGELRAGAPVDGITLQIASLISATGQVTRFAASFDRLDDLLRWTYEGIALAYGAPGDAPREWPALPSRKPGASSRANAAAA